MRRRVVVLVLQQPRHDLQLPLPLDRRVRKLILQVRVPRVLQPLDDVAQERVVHLEHEQRPRRQKQARHPLRLHVPRAAALPTTATTTATDTLLLADDPLVLARAVVAPTLLPRETLVRLLLPPPTLLQQLGQRRGPVHGDHHPLRRAQPVNQLVQTPMQQNVKGRL